MSNYDRHYSIMAISEPLLAKARTAEARLAAAQHEVEIARSEYHAIVRRMHLAGGSLREIAQALALSHQRVQQMVGGAGGSWWQKVWSSRNVRRNLACTFCKRSQDDVAKLIAGPNVFICDACVALAEQSRAGTAADHKTLKLAVEGAKTRCSFCRKQRSTERAILTGPAAGICVPCLNVCRQILIDSAD